MKKKNSAPKTSSRRRVLARVVAEDLKTAHGSNHNGGGFHTWTQCPYPCDFDID